MFVIKSPFVAFVSSQMRVHEKKIRLQSPDQRWSSNSIPCVCFRCLNELGPLELLTLTMTKNLICESANIFLLLKQAHIRFQHAYNNPQSQILLSQLYLLLWFFRSVSIDWLAGWLAGHSLVAYKQFVHVHSQDRSVQLNKNCCMCVNGAHACECAFAYKPLKCTCFIRSVH